MTAYTAPLREIAFVLRHVAGLGDVASLPGLADATPDLVDALLAEAARLAESRLAPLNQPGDRQPPTIANGAVVMPAGFREAYHDYAAGGWTGLVFPERYGGQGLPWLVNAATSEIWNAANLSLQLCPLLAQGAIDAILQHGSEAQRELYGRPLIAGRWTAAMCLTEPQAGSDVGAVRTRAVREGDGYRIFGTKIFITYGEHDLADNIVHLVLARLEGAPAGTKGISLFIVPKFLPREDGRPGRRNDLRCVSIEHKLGVRASPTCVMSYGDDLGAEGFLLGDENQGMRCMFTMMNNARLAVGNQGLGVAERAYQQSLAYAQGRIQGSRAGLPVPIVEHADVRRMLVTMRAQIAAMRALAYWTAAYVDRSRAPSRRRTATTGGGTRGAADAAREGLADRPGAGDHGECHPGPRRHGLCRGDGCGPAFPRCAHPRDLRGHQRHPGDGSGRPQARHRRWPVAMAALRRAARRVARLAGRAAVTTRYGAGGSRTNHPPFADGRAGRSRGGRVALSSPVSDQCWAASCSHGEPRRQPDAVGGAEWPGLARFYLLAVLPPALALEQQIIAGARSLNPGLLSAA